MKKHKEIPQTRLLAPTIAEIKKEVSRRYEIKESLLEQSRRGQVNEPRNVAVYLSRKLSGLRLEEIAHEFGLGSYSSVSSIVTRTESQFSENATLQKMVQEIKQEVIKSQAKT
jgi:putative transposase